MHYGVPEIIQIQTRGQGCLCHSQRGRDPRTIQEKPLDGGNCHSYSRKNESGETWLDVLIRQGNVAALDFALNPTKGVVWLIPDRKTFERADAKALFDTAKKSKNQDIIDTVTFFLSYHELRMQEIYLNYNVYKTEDMIINSDAMINFKKKVNVRRFIRYIRDWEGFQRADRKGIETVLFHLVSMGFHRLLIIAQSGT